jgi:maltooligosyltrehalose trehalohydrolase
MTAFRVWAPSARAVRVEVVGQQVRLAPHPRGWWAEDVPQAGHGDDYGFLLDDDETPVKDPRSRWQPGGAHGLSRIYDHGCFPWTDAGWRGVPLPGAVLYELHVGTFTPAGTLDSAIDRLDHLVALGIDAVELLPVNGYSGSHGWGYDGVDLYAVHEAYGGPDALKRFVDAAHARGLGVVLDVVYNHFGPSGNVLPRFGPYLTDSYTTPWGPAVNLDGPGSDEVRAFLVGNALQWLRDFHCDGLRLDAVHALVDGSAYPFLEELAEAVDELAAQTGRPLWAVAESDRNDPRLVRPREAGGAGLAGMWADDLHHAVHAVLTGERGGYYGDYGSYADVARAWTRGYVYAGRWSDYRKRSVGRPLPLETPGWRLVVALQNHDQVGNRAVGDRLSALVSAGLLRVGAAIVLLSPMTPLLFMGEEWGARTPWCYFTSHPEEDLATAVRAGRREEFAAFGWDPRSIPDPQDPATFAASILDWREPDTEEGAGLLRWYRELLRLRRTVPALGGGTLDGCDAHWDEDARWILLQRSEIVVAVNLAPARQEVPVSGSVMEVLASSAPGFAFGRGGVEVPGEGVVVARLVTPADG